MQKYDSIGQGYNTTRRADPYLAGRLCDLLIPEAGKKYVDIGCGTGNYTVALAEKGFDFTGIDPSEKMLSTARAKKPDIKWVCASAEDLPFQDKSFDGAIGTLTIHHWSDLEKAFAEIRRTLRSGGRIVLFTSSPRQMNGYWLNHYFPQMLAASIAEMPSVASVENAALKAGLEILTVEKYFVRDDLQDGFLYIGKNNPSLYFDTQIQNGISSFVSLSNADEVKAGLAQLQKDLTDGIFETVRAKYQNQDGDYLFIVVGKAT